MELKEFLNSRYDTKNFIRFISERFYGFEERTTKHTDEELNESEKQHIQSYRFLGSVELDDGKELGFFEFLSKKPNIENKRVGYNTVLKKLAENYILDGAIASFFHPDNNAWRLSFVGFEYDEGKAKVTNLKRYTYVLGEDIPTKTAYQQLSRLKYPKFDELYEIFGVEHVSKEFYEKYRELFEMINKYLIEGGYFNYFERKESNVHLFSKKLLGRIIFLYFLQKKGWLGVEKGKPWGTGQKDFLQYHLRESIQKGENYYEHRLKKIFFEALSIERPEGYFPELNCRIPFLNGGLFEADKYDKIQEISIENWVFEKIFKVFNEYNFTIIEDSPDDKEVAIDPEMMGRVFENLLEENYRKGKGAFYTPREIVHYMCQQTIIDYLLNDFDDKEAITNLVVYKITDNPYIQAHGKQIQEKLLALKILDPAIGSGAFPMGLLHEIVSIIAALNKTLKDSDIAALKRSVIENSIYGIDIDYSAVEVAKLRFWLSLVVDEEEPVPLPNLYYKIMVGNSLLESINGFDPLAKESDSLFDTNAKKITHIQKLLHRFFKVNDNEEKEKIKDEIESTIDEILLRKLQEQEEIINSQMNNINVQKGLNKRQQEHITKAMETKALIQAIKKRPTTELFFYKIYFAEVFEKGGFDIVIGNPPYIRQEKIKNLKPRLQQERFYNLLTQKIDYYECYNGTADIYIYFFEKGFKLLSSKGILSYITSNKYTRAKYGEKFRKFVLENCDIKEFVDLNGIKVFESATVDTAILSLSHKKEVDHQITYCDVGSDYQKEQNLYEYIRTHGFAYPQRALSSEAFTFSSPKELMIKERIEKVGIPLKEWDIKIYRGILTGYNEAFIIDGETKDRLIAEDPKSAKIIKPLLRGKDIDKYTYRFADKWLIFVPWHFPNHLESENMDFKNNEESFKRSYPAIYDHLSRYKEKLSSRNKAETGIRYEWYTLQRWGANYWKEFEKEKIIYSEIVQHPQFYLDSKKFYIEATAFIMTGKNLKYLIALLNSNPLAYFFRKFYMGTELGRKGYRYKKAFIEKLPIPKLSKEKQKPFETLVDIIISLKEKNDEKAHFFEDVIDIMVYEIYFEDILKEKGFGILDVVTRDLEKTKDAALLFEQWSERNHPVKYNLDFIDTLDIIKTIKEAL